MQKTLKHFQHPAILAAEKKQLSHFIATLRGYHLLLLGKHRKLSDLPPHCLHSFSLSPVNAEASTGTWVQSHYETLPLRDNSIDAVVIPYLLEYCENPDVLLQELYRSLVGEGKLFLLGFERINPWCWFNAPRTKHALYITEVIKLLKKADFTLEKIKHFHYGAIYVIVASKHLLPVTPLRPQWQKSTQWDGLLADVNTRPL